MKRALTSPVVAAVAASLCTLLTGWYLGRSAAPEPAPARPATLFMSDLDLDVRATANAKAGIWIHPGVRNLDPAVFGSVAQPTGGEFMIGVPAYDRLDDGLGNWTTTAQPTAASNNTSPLGPGSKARLIVRDRTPVDLPAFTSTTYDELDFYARFFDPQGRLLEIRATTPLPKGPFHEFFGGVGTNVIQHGRTGIGGKLVPQVFAYVTVYGKGELRIDGQLLPGNDDQLVHVMVTSGVRDVNNAAGPAGGSGPFLGTDAEVDRDDLELHVLMPGVRFRPNPMPNQPIFGVGQEFVHLLFEDVRLEGTTISGTLHR